jgi:hypothetical protein
MALRDRYSTSMRADSKVDAQFLILLLFKMKDEMVEGCWLIAEEHWRG